MKKNKIPRGPESFDAPPAPEASATEEAEHGAMRVSVRWASARDGADDVLGATAQDDLALTICMCGHAGMLEHYLAMRNPVLDDVEMQACVTKNLPECARVLVKHHHGQKDRLERFAHRVYDHAVSSRLRHKRAPFMEMAFGA